MHTESKARLSLTIDDDLDKELRVKAAENRQNISDLVSEAVRHYLKNYKRIQNAKNKEVDF
jgi:metal-responsive CopG/Arc/MetJ family transcriptional regulator